MRDFVGIDWQEGAPDETTVSTFRQLLERHKLGKKLLTTVNSYLASNDMRISNGSVVDATIISAPSSMKNKGGKRDAEIHQTAKDKQWHFGTRTHIGVDSRHKLIHTILASAADVPDSLALPHLLHGKETCVWGDQAYQGQTDTIRSVAPRAKDRTNRHYRFGQRIDAAIREKNCNKLSVRSKLEHTIGVINACSASRRCAIGGWRRTSIGSRPPRRSATCSCSSGACWRYRGRVDEISKIGERAMNRLSLYGATAVLSASAHRSAANARARLIFLSRVFRTVLRH